MSLAFWDPRNRRRDVVERRARYIGRGVAAALKWGVPAAYGLYAGKKYFPYQKQISYKGASQGGSMYNPSGGSVYGRSRRRRRYRKKKYRKRFNRGQKRYIKKVTENKIDSQNICTWRNLGSGQLSCEENECAYTQQTILDRAEIEDAIDASPVLDPNAGTLQEVDVDLTTIDGLKVRIINAKRIITFRNNGQTPCDLKVYWCSFKKRVASSLTDLLEDGLENTGITANELTDLRFDVYDSPTFNDFVKIYKTRKYRLNGGDELEVVLQRKKPVIYDPDEFDKHSASRYVPKQSLACLFRIVGVVAHDDTTTSNVGTCDATLDYTVLSHIKFSPMGGVKLKNLKTGAGTYDTMAAGSKVVVEQIEEVGETL